MRVTVIIDDATVIVDNDARVVVLPAHDPNWHAIQWYGDYGTIEVKVGERVWLESDELVQPFVDAWVVAAPPPPEEPLP